MNARDQARQFVDDFFARLGAIPGKDDREKMACDYIQAGLIDSLGIFNLIGEIEERLGVALTGDDLEDPKFKTIGGLTDLLAKKLERQ